MRAACGCGADHARRNRSSRHVEPTGRRVNRPIFVNDSEIQGATIGETQRELESETVKAGDVESVMSSHASLHFKVGRHRLTRIGKMLVDVEMVVDASDR